MGDMCLTYISAKDESVSHMQTSTAPFNEGEMCVTNMGTKGEHIPYIQTSTTPFHGRGEQVFQIILLPRLGLDYYQGLTDSSSFGQWQPYCVLAEEGKPPVTPRVTNLYILALVV